MNNIITEIVTKDPLILISAGISILSLIFIIILSYYYKKIKEEQTISEIVSSVEEPKITSRRKEEKISREKVTYTPDIGQKKDVLSDIEVVIAQINELTTQVNSLNNYIKEISSVVKTLQQKQKEPSVDLSLSEETIAKLINVLQKVQTDLTSLLEASQNSSTTVSEVNKKLDNLLKLISTILQQ